jgi:uncharacterized iron-regulated membrane protein
MSQRRAISDRAVRARGVALVIHRYAGLIMTVFLTVAGLTGTLLVFYRELDAALNPSLMRVAPPTAGAHVLEPFELQERIQALFPGQTERVVRFDQEPDESLSVWITLGPERSREVFISPYTGEVLGSRNWGDLSDGFVRNLMPFVYRLHYSLAIEGVGTVLFGLVALIWTVDCFVGAYLTFPSPARRDAGRGSGWLRRWLPAWQLRTTRLFAFAFTWHRASGLWIWALLLVFAWSAVGLNLQQVYRPVMATVAGLEPTTRDRLPELPEPHSEPRLSMRSAHTAGRQLMAAEARRRGFEIRRELWLEQHPGQGAYAYAVESSLDLSSRFARTEIYFDDGSGELMGFDARTSLAAGNTITSWLLGLHFAAIWGLWYRIVVACSGIMIAGLSVTGVWIWLRKRAKRSRESDVTSAAPKAVASLIQRSDEPFLDGSGTTSR